MHELGIVYNVVETVLKVADENMITAIDTLVLEIGRESHVVPRFIESCYPAAVDGTLMESTKLQIEIIEGRGFNIKQIMGC